MEDWQKEMREEFAEAIDEMFYMLTLSPNFDEVRREVAIFLIAPNSTMAALAPKNVKAASAARQTPHIMGVVARPAMLLKRATDLNIDQVLMGKMTHAELFRLAEERMKTMPDDEVLFVLASISRTAFVYKRWTRPAKTVNAAGGSA